MPLVVAIVGGFLLRISKTDLCKSVKGPCARSAVCPRARRLRKGEEGIGSGLHAASPVIPALPHPPAACLQVALGESALLRGAWGQ